MNTKTIIALILAGGGIAMAQETTKGRIYIGTTQGAPNWVWQVPKASADANQLAANAACAKGVDLAWAQQRVDAQKAMLSEETARAEYLADPRNRMLRPEAGGPQFTRERGVILDYNPNTLLGVISGEDSKRWPFRGAEWAEHKANPKRGLWVDFVPEAETGYALFVYSLGPFAAKHLELESRR